MTTDVKDITDVLGRSHRTLAGLADRLRPEEVRRPSYCRDWTVAQVYSHLGSGAEIGLVALHAGIAGGTEPDPQPIWDRWNALAPEQMVRGFVEADERYVTALAGLDAGQLDSVRIPFHGSHIDVRTATIFRLAEHAVHSWDIRVAFDPAAEVAPDAAAILADHYPDSVIDMIADRETAARIAPTAIQVDLVEPSRTLVLNVHDSVTLSRSPGQTGPVSSHLRLPTAGAWARLLGGRLDPQHTPDGTVADEATILTDLRALFPGT